MPAPLRRTDRIRKITLQDAMPPPRNPCGTRLTGGKLEPLKPLLSTETQFDNIGEEVGITV